MKKYIAEIEHILKAFKIEDSFPSVFDPNIMPKFVDFIERLDVNSFPKDFRLIYIILEFVRTMRSARQQVFLARGVPTAVTQIVPDNVYIKLIALQMDDIGIELWNSVRRTGIPDTFRPVRSAVVCNVVEGKHVITVSTLLDVKRQGQSMDALVESLRGKVYSTTSVPPPIRQKYQRLNARAKSRSLLRTSDALMRDMDTSRWLRIETNAHFSTYLVRCKDDRLAFRYTVTVPAVPMFRKPTALLKLLVKLWKQAFQKL